MPEEPHPFFHGEAKLFALLLVLAGLAYATGLGGTDLWDPDEPRFAQVAREMMRRDDWVLPHLNGEPYHHKPPLYYWLIAAASKATGGEVTALSTRIPSVVMGLASILLTYLLGRLLWSRAAGFLGACAFATCALTLYLSRRGSIDTTLTAFTALALYAFARNAFLERPRYLWDLLFMIACALAVLSKGPVGLIIPLGTAIFFSIVAGRKRAVTARYIAGVAAAALVFFAITLSWVIPACIRGGTDYTLALLLKQTVQRAADPWSHERPFPYYFANFPWCSFPWILLFATGCWHLVVATKQEDRRPVVFLFVWFVFVFAMFTASASKRQVYLLPLLPAAALIVGKLVADCAFRPPAVPVPRRLGVPLAITGVLVALLGAVGVIGGLWGRPILEERDPGKDILDAYDLLHVPVTWISLALFGSGMVTILGVCYRRAAVSFAALVLAVAGTTAAAALWVLPGVDPYKSPRELCTRMNARLKPGDEVAMYNLDHEGIMFYLDRRMLIFDKTETDGLVDFTRGEATRYVMVDSEDFEKRLAPRKDLRLERVDFQGVGHRKIEVYEAVR